MTDPFGRAATAALTATVLAAITGCISGPGGHTGLRWEEQRSGVDRSLRGICAVSPDVAWASGANGTFLRTVDGGDTWEAGVVPDAGDLDFRDVHSVSATTAWLFAAGSPADFYKTEDGGRSWTRQHSDARTDVFFDAIAFWNADNGLAFGDPIDGSFLVLRTRDGGSHWTPLPGEILPPPLPGEAGFAASGTCVAVWGILHAWIGTGGAAARVLRSHDGGDSWAVADTPIRSGEPSRGIFSLAFRDARHGIAVGGDYRDEDATAGNAAVTDDGGATWTLIETAPPRGYRSAVAWIPFRATPTCVAVGPNGTDLSTDGGRTWRPLGDTGYHAVAFTPAGDAGWAVGSDGRIARLFGLGP